MHDAPTVSAPSFPDTAPIKPPRKRRRWLWWIGGAILVLGVWQLSSSVAPTVVPSPVKAAAAVTDEIYDAAYGADIIERAHQLPREVNILVVGLDNRVASNDNHADAIHLVSIRTKDSVGVTIYSVPRGTEVKGYNIDPDLSFMANVRALRGRKALMGAVARLCGKKKIDYYIEVTFSHVMGVLELLGYKDPATALQYLRHRKSYALGDVQRSYNQGKFIRHQLIKRGDLLTGAKGDVLMRMGLGMVDTDLDLNTAQAIVYLLREAQAMDEEHVAVEMRPRINYSRLDSTDTPDPNQIGNVVNMLVRRTGGMIDDLGRYNPYPKLRDIITRASALSKNPKATIAVLEPLYEQKAWLQVQERPQRAQLRDSVEDMLVRSYIALKKPEKAQAVHDYMVNERKAFSEVERETRSFSYGRRQGVAHHEPNDAAAVRRAQQDNAGQKQTRVQPQETHTNSPSHDVLRNDGHDTKPATQNGASKPEHPAEDDKPSTPPDNTPHPNEGSRAQRKDDAPKELEVVPINDGKP